MKEQNEIFLLMLSVIHLFNYLFIYAYNFLRSVVRQEQDACTYAEDQAKALSKEKEKLEEQIKVRKEPVWGPRK